jgi:HEAT repeat protein
MTALPVTLRFVARRDDHDERTARLFRARGEGDTSYLIESLLREPEFAPLPAQWLADMECAEAVPALVRVLDAANPEARAHAARALYRLGPPPETKARLIEMANSDPETAASMWATTALGRFRDSSLVPLLLSQLGSPNWRIRSAAATALGETGDPGALEALRRARRRELLSPASWVMNRSAYNKAIASLRA